MRILITGAKGQVGRELVLVAQQQEISYFACDHSQLDITDSVAVDELLRTQDIDVVINAAAYTAVDVAEQDVDAAYRVNRDGVENLALACRSYDVPLIHISTDFVFDGKQSEAYNETDSTDPLSIYGKSKLIGEEMLVQSWEKHIILRTSWVYSVHGSNFVKTMLRLMQERDQLQVVNDQWGCPTSARSIAKALIDIARSVVEKGASNWGVYHFSAKGRTNWYEFAKEILAQANQYSILNVSIQPITSQEWLCAAERPRNSELSCDKIAVNFGIQRVRWQSELPQVIADLIAT
ncbi:MAG: dTDP-4-dehydrorhamnose reductase [Gammaproteobacteria bacterium]|nr:MAG: dTDP-4-dehydrorhamnose reductase [Gammaproteobacteria bacterium]PCH62683.1 MAG: dTDP-4-dehydrorhamnose reductase [Gammaproteobacteria bacterium]